MINFDSLPTKKPTTTIPKGTYYGVIEDAVMKQGKDLSKPPYLNVKYSVKDKDGKSMGALFDIISESDKSLMQYKLKRFIEATGIELKAFELKDLAKIIKGKQLILDIMIDSQEGYTDKSVVDLFSGEIYYPISEAKDIFGNETSFIEITDEELDSINASDAEDAEDDMEF